MNDEIGLALPALNSLQEHTGYSYGVTAAVIVQSMMSIIVFVALSKVLLPYNCPPMTLPFDILCSMLLLASFGMANMDFDVHPTLPEHNMLMNDEAFYGINLYKFVLITLRGVGQIVFSPNICSCVLLVISMAVCSWRIAAYSLLGSALGKCLEVKEYILVFPIPSHSDLSLCFLLRIHYCNSCRNIFG